MIEIKRPDLSYTEYPGPILLLAGPGTGKTWQLGRRVKYLVEQRGAKPDEVAIITFTNEAARNMREELAKDDLALPPERTPGVISTMHSLGNSIVGTAPKIFGLPEDYDVLHDKEGREVLLQDAATIAGYAREGASDTDACRRMGNCRPDKESQKCTICREYQGLLRKCGRVDYDDHILLACEALRANASLLAQWQGRARYLLVDEYQDINEAQCKLIRMLSAGNPDGLFAAGDDDQSIYSFRGGSPKYIREFERHFGKRVKVGRLAVSYRCPEHILRGAHALVTAYYRESVPKPDPQFSEKIKHNNKIVFYDVPSDKWEANIIAGLAEDRIGSGTVIIIIPNGNYLPPIKEALKRRGLDFTYRREIEPSGIVRFAVLADWAENPDENINMRYLLDLIVHNHDSLAQKMDAPEVKLTARRLAASELLASLWGSVGSRKSFYAVLRGRAAAEHEEGFLAGLINCLDEARALVTENGKKRMALPKFLEQCGLLVAPGKYPMGIVNAVRDWRAERLSSRRSSSYPPVRIYNMPSSKGLQGDVVAVVGLSKGLFPRRDADVQEESRLLYVAMTRAEKELHLFSARSRPGSITFLGASYQLERSPFIDAIPEQHIESKVIYPRKKRKST